MVTSFQLLVLLKNRNSYIARVTNLQLKSLHRSRARKRWLALKKQFKGIVSRKFCILFLVSFESLEVSTPFYFLRFLKYRRFHVEFSNIRCSVVSVY
jgi:hypothetical protein